MILLIFILINLFLQQQLIAQNSLYRPLERSPEEVLGGERSNWRFADFEIYTWNKLDRVLIFDFASYAVQDRFFKRLAFFCEKLGYAGEIPRLADIKGLHGYNAHNYASLDLARFYNLAAGDLSLEEQQLKDILVASGILGLREEGVYPNGGGLISVSRTSSETLRRFLLIHELMHGIYYTLPVYQEGVGKLWLGLDEKEKEFWILFLESKFYDINNSGLVINEFQAYLLQQQKENISWFLLDRGLAEIKKMLPAYSGFAADFRQSCGDCLLKQATGVEELLLQTGLSYGYNFLEYMNAMKLY